MKPGDLVNWHYVPRGGYGFGHSVPAQVIKVCPKKVRIRALTSKRIWRELSVLPEKLSPRTTRVPEDDTV